MGNGRISLEAARLGKLHEVSLADTQKAVQDAVQVSKSFLASSCCPRVLFYVDQPCTDVLDTLGHLKWYWTPLFKQLNPTLSGLLKIIYKASVRAGTQAQTSSRAIHILITGTCLVSRMNISIWWVWLDLFLLFSFWNNLTSQGSLKEVLQWMTNASPQCMSCTGKG